MSPPNLLRMSGLALVVAGAMFVFAELISLSVLAQGDVDELRQIAATNSSSSPARPWSAASSC